MTNETKWTPWPWKLVGDGHWVNGGYEDGGIQVATVGGKRSDKSMKHCHERWNADAHLIAAAPDLYKALEQAVTSMLDSGYSTRSVAVRAGQGVLAKARGEHE